MCPPSSGLRISRKWWRCSARIFANSAVWGRGRLGDDSTGARLPIQIGWAGVSTGDKTNREDGSSQNTGKAGG